MAAEILALPLQEKINTFLSI